jgi:hypothetical protein
MTVGTQKLTGSQMTSAEVLTKVASIVEATNGYAASKVSRNTRLCEDAGVAGDDGDDLLTALDNAFEMDWQGIDSGVIFGNEGFGPPPLWLLRNNCDLYERQTLTIGELVDSLQEGRWLHPTPMIPLVGARRMCVYLGSLVTTLIFGSLPLLLCAALIGWMLGV